MRYVKLAKLGTPSMERAEMVIPYNGNEFEFLSEYWRGLARRAAATERGDLREGDYYARVYDPERGDF